MMDNHTYNIMKQLVQEHKSLWRIKNNYLKDASGHDDCITFWNELATQKEKVVEELTALLKKYLD